MTFNVTKTSKIEEIRKAFTERGAELVSTEYVNARTPLNFKCSKCGQLHHITWNKFSQGVNPNLLCPSCSNCSRYKQPTLDEIRKAFIERGAELVSSEYVNAHIPLEFKCTQCGSVHSICWDAFKRGANPNLLCLDCSFRRQPTIDEIKAIFEEVGAVLVTSEYRNNITPLEFKCSKCGEMHSITWGNFIKGANPNLLCTKCIMGGLVNPEGSKSSRRTNVAIHWESWVKEFFNVSNYTEYESHHILRISTYPEYSCSITNGFPLRKEYHEGALQNPIHIEEIYFNPENWPTHFKLPYHNYENFKFLNLNEHFLMEVIYNEEWSKGLLKKKEEKAAEGKFYIPVYVEESYLPTKRRIICSMIKNRLSRIYGDEIYKYTNTRYERIYARNTDIRILSQAEEMNFMELCHIQGYVRSSICYGLFYKQKLVMAMSFGSPRVKQHKGETHWELLRMCSLLDTNVIGGAAKLFKYFQRDKNPEYVISYCDIRFSSISPYETVYPKLGFTFDGKTSPNYKYTHPEMQRLFSRQLFQKWKLEKKLEKFDPNLTEYENMKANGYYRLYDCGNYRFIWTSKEKDK